MSPPTQDPEAGNSSRPRHSARAADELYAELITAMRDMDESQALRFSARLVLLLIAHVDDPQLVRAAIQAAQRSSSDLTAEG